MIAYRAFSQKFNMEEKARFWPMVLTVVKAPEKATQAAAVRAMDIRERSQRVDTMYMLNSGPKIPTMDETVQSR